MLARLVCPCGRLARVVHRTRGKRTDNGSTDVSPCLELAPIQPLLESDCHRRAAPKNRHKRAVAKDALYSHCDRCLGRSGIDTLCLQWVAKLSPGGLDTPVPYEDPLDVAPNKLPILWALVHADAHYLVW